MIATMRRLDESVQLADGQKSMDLMAADETNSQFLQVPLSGDFGVSR